VITYDIYVKTIHRKPFKLISGFTDIDQALYIRQALTQICIRERAL